MEKNLTKQYKIAWEIRDMLCLLRCDVSDIEYTISSYLEYRREEFHIDVVNKVKALHPEFIKCIQYVNKIEELYKKL